MRIKELIKARKLTAKEVATKAGITEAMFSNIANDKGNPNLQTLLKIADALHVSIAELFTDEINHNKLVAFIHCNGAGHTPTTIDQVMSILKNWNEDEFHKVCHSITFNHIRDKYEGNVAIQELVLSLCTLLKENGYHSDVCG